MQRAFKDSKVKLTSAAALAFVELEKPFVVQNKLPSVAVGAFLLQTHCGERAREGKGGKKQERVREREREREGERGRVEREGNGRASDTHGNICDEEAQRISAGPNAVSTNHGSPGSEIYFS